MKRKPSNAVFGYTFLFVLLVWGMTSCSKGGSNNGGGSSSSTEGTGADLTTGPTNVWLQGFSNVNSGDSAYTELVLNSDHSIQKVIIKDYSPSDTNYSAIIPVYTGGKISALQTSTDTTASTGQAFANFTYGSGWIKAAYNAGTSSYNYDSVVVSDHRIGSIYRYEPAGAAQKPILFQSETFTWNNQNDISTVVINTIDTTSGATSAQTITFTYDGSFNPYRTLTDAAFILGTIDNNVTFLNANNPTNAEIVGFSFSNSYLYQYNAQSLPTLQTFEYLQSGAVKTSSLTYFQYIAQN